ncbi:MAG TPA: TolC family protein [Thermoanaerobaculia bacterium]|nr:TolC family protein [Thermoanaerobaculia bacterium]
MNKLISLSVLLLVAAASAGAAEVLTLDQALAAARANQPLVRQAAAATAAAEGASAQARAALRPQVTGSANLQRTTANFVSRPGSLPSQVSTAPSSESFKTFGYSNLGLNANLLLFDFGQARNRWRSAQASEAGLRESQRAALDDALLAVRLDYFRARAAKELVGVADETLANQRKHLDQAKGFVDVGTQAPIAVAQAKTGVANAQVQLINAQNDYETAKAELNQAMGVERSTDYDVADDPESAIDGEDGAPEALFQEALNARPELAALAHQVRAQELTVKAARASHAPNLQLATGFTDAGRRIDDLTWNWNGALVVGVPIYLGGLTRAETTIAEANLESVKAQLDGERLEIRLDVDQARLAVRAAKEALAASGEAIESAREQLRLAEGRYQTGFGGILELSDAQVAATAAAQQRVQAQYTLSQARAQLQRALGRS